MVLTNEIVRTLLAVGRRVAIGEAIAGQTLAAGNSSAFENRERDARKPAYVDFIGS